MSAKTYDRQSGKLIARISENLPEMSSDVMQGWIDNPKGLQKFLEGLCPVNIVPSFRFDKRQDGWKLLENTPRRLTSANIEGISFLKGKEPCINGEEMARRAVTLDANLGQEDAEYLLEHQDEIPAELRGLYLVFPGTKWRDADGCRRVPFLSWYDGQWILYFYWLDYVWNSYDRLVRPLK